MKRSDSSPAGGIDSQRPGCPPRGGIRREPEAKRCPDEQKAHPRRRRGDKQPYACEVQCLRGKRRRICAGEKREGFPSYLGRSAACRGKLRACPPRAKSARAGTPRQKSAEGVVAAVEHRDTQMRNS